MQLFDSWVGALSPADYDEFVAPWSARILAAAGAPTIHFGTGTATLLEAMAAAGGDVIGLDWRIRLDDGWAPRRAIAACRGTSTRPSCSGPGSASEARALDVLRRAAGGPGTSSTSATASCPAPIPMRSRGWRRSCVSTSPRSPRDAGAFPASATVRAMSDSAVILMAYGSPERLADVPAYYADIRGGRPIAPEQLDDLVARYRRLGIEDANPLNAITERTRAALEQELGLPVFTGMKHWMPRIADAVDSARAIGARRLVGLVLAPHYSRLSIGGYQRLLDEAVDGREDVLFVASWHDDPGLIAVLADRVRGTSAHVVFTAHSLPARILDEGDPYADQLLETSVLVAREAGVSDWSFSYQSESPTGEPWLGPDILDHLAELHAAASTTSSSVPSGSCRIISRSGWISTPRPRSSRRARHARRAHRHAERRSRVRACARQIVRRTLSAVTA